MNEEHRAITELSELFRAPWFWLLPIFGGIGDYVILMWRGIKPRSPLLAVICSMILHCAVALVTGCTLALGVGALGYQEPLQFAAAGALGGLLGVRIVDIVMLLIKIKTGATQ